MEAKRAAVKESIIAEIATRKGKKGFLTPERKKKLRLLLRNGATAALKKEQEMKSAERRRVIEERSGKLPRTFEEAGDDELRRIMKGFAERIAKLESAKYDLEYAVKMKDYEINELNLLVNPMKGKFVKPTLKKVSKYENKFAKLQQKAAEFNFRNQLKQVKKKEFLLEEEEKEKDKHDTKPDWSKKGKGSEEIETY